MKRGVIGILACMLLATSLLLAAGTSDISESAAINENLPPVVSDRLASFEVGISEDACDYDSPCSAASKNLDQPDKDRTNGVSSEVNELSPGIGSSFGEPTFVYQTVVTGYYLASGRGIAVDPDGNAYVIARTIGNENDILVVKLDAEGTVLWTTYIDGSDHDYAEDIVLDSAKDVYITGWTDSNDFPIVNGLDDTLTGFRDAFVMKLSKVDGAILYSTLLGGDYTDQGHGIILNDAGEIYMVGSTGSTDFPTTEDAYQDEPSAPLYIYTDAFITKLNAAGDEILYSTYFGGFKDDWAYDVALDNAGNIVFSGKTNADDFPLVNPIQSDPNSIFISKLSADGSTLQFSTYLGGEDFDRLGGMVLDSEGFVYIAGSTRSISFPTTPGAYQEEFVGEILGCEVPFGGHYNCDDVFVTKLGMDGSGLVYSTYLGGSRVEECRGIAVDSQGYVHVVGYTNSSDFPPNGTDFPAEIFVSKFNPSGSDLMYTVTVDSGSANQGHGVAVDDEDDVYFAGAVNVPADVYIAKITEGPPVWTNIFQDPARSTELRINTHAETFQFLAPDYDSGVVHATEMTSVGDFLFGEGYAIGSFASFQFSAKLSDDLCLARAVVWDPNQTPKLKLYWLYDPAGAE